MKRQWILLANASHARLLSRDSATDPLVPLATLEHPESRLKASQLADDRAGHEATDNSSGGNRYEPRSDVRRKEQAVRTRNRTPIGCGSGRWRIQRALALRLEPVPG